MLGTHAPRVNVVPRARPALRRSTILITLLAVAFLIAGLSVAYRQARPRVASESVPKLDLDDTTLVTRALEQIPMDSTAIKQGWVDEVKGIEVARLAPDQLERFVRFANARQCTCGCGFTLAACRTYDPTCPVSEPAAEALRDSILAGHLKSAEGLRTRTGLPPGHP